MSETQTRLRPTGPAPREYPHDAIENLFTYRAPMAGQPERYAFIRGEGMRLADRIVRCCPASSERDTAIERLREAVMWANAAIACNE